MDIFLVLKEIVKHTSRVESRSNFTGKSCGSWLMITLFCSTCFTIPKNFDLECIELCVLMKSVHGSGGMYEKNSSDIDIANIILRILRIKKKKKKYLKE